VGGIGTLVPGTLLIGFGIAALVTGRPSANPITTSNVMPDLTDLGSLNLWASIAFAYGGLELSPSMAGEVQRPERTLYRAVLVSAPICATVYLLGSSSLLWLLPSGELNIVSGILQGIARGAREVAPTLTWLVPLAALSVAVGNVGGVGAWLTGPARIAFVIGLDRYFPPAFGKVHPKWGTPYVAILVQAVLASIALVLSIIGKGTSVETVYLIMLDMQLLLYFIPFVYLFVSLVILRRRDRAAGVVNRTADAALLAASGAFVTIFAMVIAMIPPSGEEHKTLFFGKVLGGALIFIGAGAIVYWRGVRRGPATSS
jgi:amino acid transporter